MQPYNTRAVYKVGRKRFLFETRYDNKTLFDWFNRERLDMLAVRYPFNYISGIFWAEGSIIIMVGNRLISPYISFSIKPSSSGINNPSPHEGIDFRLGKALEELRKYYPNVRYKVYVGRKGIDEGKRTYILKGDIVRLILYNNPSNYRFFRILFVEKKINLYEYLIAYTLDTTTLNRVLGNILNKGIKYKYSLFDLWILNNVFEIVCPEQQFKHLYELKSTERTIKLYNELNIYNYKDLLRYSKKAYKLMATINNEIANKLIFSALNNIYANTAKHFMKLLEIYRRENNNVKLSCNTFWLCN